MNIHDSVAQVMNSKAAFGEAFYEVFFKRYPEVQAYFSGLDMKRQALVLTMAVAVVEQHYSSPHAATEKYIQYLGTQHYSRAIPRDLYPKWREAMLETLQRFLGDEWTDELATEWAKAINLCTEVMFEGYTERFTV